MGHKLIFSRVVQGWTDGIAFLPSFIVIFRVDFTVSTLVPWALFWRPILDLVMQPVLAPPAIWTGTRNSSELDHQSYQPPLTPTFVVPRTPPKPPSVTARHSSIKAFHTVFHRKQPKPDISGNSSVQSVTVTTTTNPASTNDKDPRPPYPAMLPAPLPVVSNKEIHEEEDCPVCLEPLSFSFRLPGEKPHIVPECGHALHEVSSFTLLHTGTV